MNPFVDFNEKNSAVLEQLVESRLPRKLATSIVKNCLWENDNLIEETSGGIVRGCNIYVNKDTEEITFKSPQAGEHILCGEKCSCGIEKFDFFHSCLETLLRGWLRHSKFILTSEYLGKISKMSE